MVWKMSQESLSVAQRVWLQSPVDIARDHVRGDPESKRTITIVLYGDYLWEQATGFIEMAGLKALRQPRGVQPSVAR